MSGSSDYTRTPYYALYKPTYDADEDEWGAHLNINADILDTTLYNLSVGQAGGPFLTQSTADGRYLQLSGGTIQPGNLVVTYSGTSGRVICAPTDENAAYSGRPRQLQSYYIATAGGGSFTDVAVNAEFYTAINGAPNTGLWNVLASVDYNGTGGNGGHVAMNTQAIRRVVNAGGPSNNPQLWSANLQVLDYTNTDSAQSNYLSGMEIGFACGNTDSANNRRIIGVYLDTANTTDVPPTCNLGLHIAANHGSYNWITRFDAPFNTAAIDTRGSTQNSGAHAIWLGNGQHIAWNSAGTATSYWDTAIFSGAGGLHQNANVLIGGSLYANSGTLGWSSSNFGQQILVSSSSNTPAIGISDANGANWIALTGGNNLQILGMPLPSNSSAAPTQYLQVGPTSIVAFLPMTVASLAATGTVSGAGFTNLFAAPPAIGGITRAAGAFTTLSATSGLTVTGAATSIGSATTSQQLLINGAAGQARSIIFETAGVARWIIQADTDAETGSNNGSSLIFGRCGDNGTYYDNPLSINRANAFVQINMGLIPVGDNAIPCGASGHRWSAVWAANGTIQTSDPREKRDIAALPDNCLELVQAIDPIRYHWKDHDDGCRWGFSAPDIKAVMQERGLDFAGVVEPDDGPIGLHADQLVPILWRAVQELMRRTGV